MTEEPSTSQRAPASAPSIRRAWLTLADGLHTQRVHLHLAEWRQAIDNDAPLPDLDDNVGARTFAGARVTVGTAVPGRFDDSGLRRWVDTALTLRVGDGTQNPLTVAAETRATELVGAAEGSWADELRAACHCAAWWVGFFAVIRHQGVHHLTLEPDKPTLSLRSLSDATDVVALGLGLRAVEAHVCTAETRDPEAMNTYCRAVTATIDAERRLPNLLAELAELRLVDLVSLSIPWRGRLTKYSGGAGAGQVE